MTNPDDKRRAQTANARAVKSRKYEERLASILRERGWTVVAPISEDSDHA